MKKFICILLMFLFTLPVLAEGTPLAEGAPLAEDNPFAPYTIAVPEGAELTGSEGTYTFVQDMSRVVAILIERVPDEDPAAAVIRMMAQFDPEAVIGKDLPMAEGFVGLEALAEDKLGAGVDQRTVMILSQEGELLILSGYSLEGDEEAAQSLLEQVLRGITVNGQSIYLTKE